MVPEEKTIVAYWLCPAEPARSHFSEIINDFAGRFDAPVFEPHVTIYVAGDPDENPGAVLEQALKNRREYRLVIRGVDYSDKFTQTVFVQFEPDAELTRLTSYLRRASPVQHDYELNPHLSMIYKVMARETKSDLAASIRLSFSEVSFDSVKAVISPAKIRSRADVEAWRVVATHRLTG